MIVILKSIAMIDSRQKKRIVFKTFSVILLSSL